MKNIRKQTCIKFIEIDPNYDPYSHYVSFRAVSNNRYLYIPIVRKSQRRTSRRACRSRYAVLRMGVALYLTRGHQFWSFTDERRTYVLERERCQGQTVWTPKGEECPFLKLLIICKLVLVLFSVYRKRRNFRGGLIFVGKQHPRRLNPRKFVLTKN